MIINDGTISFSTGRPLLTLPSLTLGVGGELAGTDDVLGQRAVHGDRRQPQRAGHGDGQRRAGHRRHRGAVPGQRLHAGQHRVRQLDRRQHQPRARRDDPERARTHTFEVQADQFPQLNAFVLNQAEGSAAVFANAGLFHVRARDRQLQSVALDNAGTIQVDDGTLFLQPLSARPAVWTGTFTGGPGSTLVLAGPHGLRPGSSVTGPAVQFASPFGPIIISGTYDVTVSTSTTLASPAVSFTAEATVVAAGAVSIDSGSISFSTGTRSPCPA